MNNVILSGKYPIFAQKLNKLGYNVILSEDIECFIPYERDHADMQVLIINETAFVLSRCKRLIKVLSKRYNIVECGEYISGKYPDNVVLNAAVVGKRVIARLDSLDKKVKEYCINNGYELNNVKQGYTKCSCAVVSDNAIITADKGVHNSLKESNIDVLMIEEGRAVLEGANYGFIGGASGLDTREDKRVLYFSGKIEALPEFHRIKEFCQIRGTEVIALSEKQLTDIGGMVFC